MIFREHKTPIRASSNTAYNLADLISQLQHTDDPEVVAMFEDAVEEAGEGFRVYVTTCLDLATDLSLSAEAIEREIERLQMLKQERKSRANRLQESVKTYMEMVGTSEIVTDLYTVKLRKNPPKVEITDELVIHKEYKREVVEYKLDKKAIAEALKAGVVVDGARLVQTNRLEVK
jgi:hypothetical protein